MHEPPGHGKVFLGAVGLYAVIGVFRQADYADGIVLFSHVDPLLYRMFFMVSG
jgi:hypothetical protein